MASEPQFLWHAFENRRIVKGRPDGQSPGAENDILVPGMAEWMAEYLNGIEAENAQLRQQVEELTKALSDYHRDFYSTNLVWSLL